MSFRSFTIAARVATAVALGTCSFAAHAASPKSAIAKSQASKKNLEGVVALYGEPARTSRTESVVKSNGSNFPGAADLPDDSSLRLGSF